MSRALLWIMALVLWCSQCSTFEFHFKSPSGTEIPNISKYCETSVCLVKCCPEKQIRLYVSEDEGSCVKSSELIEKYGVKNPDDYSEIPVYSKNIKRKVVKTKKSVNDFKFIYDTNFTDFAQYLSSFEDSTQYRTYLLEDGRWALRRVNYWHQWDIFKQRQFCIEHEVYLDENGTLESTSPSVVVWVIPEGTPPTNRRAVLSAYALLVSCFFLALVLAVYALLPKLRNLAGMIVMACVATYFAFFLIRIIQVFSNESQILPKDGCITLTIIFYYLMLATFCWINVMSFDIWWIFRGFGKLSKKSHRGARYKFRWYCAYAWGLPTLPTLFVIIVDQLDLTHLPDFVKPHIFDNTCYFETDVHFLYVGIPILILNLGNVILFLITAYNIWQVRRGISQYNSKDSANNKRHEYRFCLYLKLSLVMGVSWILEVAGNLVNTESPAWCILDLYNALIGFFIFLIFVCKRKIFLELCSRFSIDNEFVRSMRRAVDARAPDVRTKSSTSHHTDTSDAEVEVNWTPSYKNIISKSADI